LFNLIFPLVPKQPCISHIINLWISKLACFSLHFRSSYFLEFGRYIFFLLHNLFVNFIKWFECYNLCGFCFQSEIFGSGRWESIVCWSEIRRVIRIFSTLRDLLVTDCFLDKLDIGFKTFLVLLNFFNHFLQLSRFFRLSFKKISGVLFEWSGLSLKRIKFLIKLLSDWFLETLQLIANLKVFWLINNLWTNVNNVLLVEELFLQVKKTNMIIH